MLGRLRRAMTVAVNCVSVNRSLQRVTALRFFVRIRGDWTCACGFSNFASRVVCFQCHRGKPIPQHLVEEAKKTVGLQHTGFKNGDWMCNCGAHNFAKREFCISCEAPRLKLGSDKGQEVKGQRLLPGDWLCVKCNAHNFRGRKECLQCGSKPAAASAAVSSDCVGGSCSSNDTNADVTQSPWTCLTCHTVNSNHATSCEVCGSPHKTPTVSSSPATRADDWQCDTCGFFNFSSRVRCKNCRTPCKSASGAIDPSLWICECGYKNYRDRGSCRDCGALKTVKA